MQCPACGASTHAEERFCEACGAPLYPAEQSPAELVPVELVPVELVPAEQSPAAARTCACGGHFAEDGYCEQCGSPAPRERDHVVETPAGWVGGVCDRGRRHTRNEDALALAACGLSADDGSAVLVVCDGVSSAPDSDVASLAAARAARDALAAAVLGDAATGDAAMGDAARAGAAIGGADGSDTEDGSPLLAAAVEAANAAVIANTADHAAENPPSCTIVAATVQAGGATVASIGDSRAYWLPDGQPSAARALTRDDSLAAEAIAVGVPAQVAEQMRGAHTITKWLGVDGPSLEPAVSRAALDSPGWLLLCSDGLWNYCSAAPALAELVSTHAQRHGPDPTALAESLVSWANEQGGADNITVALARIEASGRDARPAAAHPLDGATD